MFEFWNKKNVAILISIFLFEIFFTFFYVGIDKSNERNIGYIAFKQGDTESYIGSFENLHIKGEYYFESRGEKVYAGRMPYYGIFYYLLRFFFDYSTSCDILSIIQLLIFAIAKTILIYFVGLLVTNKLILNFFTVLIILERGMAFWWRSILPESLSISFMIFFIYFFYQFITLKKSKDFWISSIILAYLVGLKAYFIPFYIMYLFYWLIEGVINKKEINPKIVLYSFIPLIIMLTPWVIRNYLKLDKFIPLQQDMMAGYKYSKTEVAALEFVKSWGGNNSYWSSETPSYFFMNKEINKNYKFPEYIYTSKFNYDTLLKYRSHVLEMKFNYNQNLDSLYADKFEKLKESLAHEKPVIYYFYSRIIAFKGFLLHSGSYFISAIYKYKYIQSLIYYIILFFGFLSSIISIHGCITYILSKKSDFFIYFKILTITMPFFIVLSIFPITFKSSEWRYLWSVYPNFIILCTCIFIKYTEFTKKS